MRVNIPRTQSYPLITVVIRTRYDALYRRKLRQGTNYFGDYIELIRMLSLLSVSYSRPTNGSSATIVSDSHKSLREMN